MAKTRILIVDDEVGMLEVCSDTLQKLPDTEVLVELHSVRAAERIAAESVDLLIADIRMPGLDGVELLRLARRHDPNMAVLMLTAYPTIETAVESMRLGAVEYIVKPFLPEDLLAIVKRLVESRRLSDENRLLRRHVERSYAFDQILGRSAGIQQVLERVQQVAATQFDALIMGETGTGKELVARAIHQRGPWNEGPFVPVDCGAIPEDLMESEFFGHERGAFTGAHTRSMGLLELANHGTFFLDEIGQLPLRLQAKLLRVLQERCVRRVGGTREIGLQLRILAASSVNLEREVERERFRLDLYHRIHVIRISLPPLRERSEDIPTLAESFLASLGKEMGRGPFRLEPEAVEVLTNYAWPGNVRELQNVLKRTVAMLPHEDISVEDLPDDVVARAGEMRTREPGGFFELRQRHLAAFEVDYMRKLLAVYQGDVSSAAREAKLPRGTLYRLLKKCDLDPASFRSNTNGS